MKQRPAPNLSRITPEEWAYIAGFIDGEGSFSVIHSKTRWCGLRISANQRDPRPLWWIQERIGGTVTRCMKLNPNTGKRVVMWTWQSSARQRVYVIIRSIWPYLIVKAEQADLLLQYKPSLALHHRLHRVRQETRG